VRMGDRTGTWLQIGAIEAETVPLDLLQGELHFTRILVQDATVQRSPQSEGPSEEPTSLSLPSMTIPLRVDSLPLRPVKLAQAVFGQPVTLAASGSAALGRSAREAQLSFTAERIDGTPGRVRLLLEQDPASARFTLQAEIEEPQGGL